MSREHIEKCQTPGKTPIVLWKKYQNRLPTEEEIRTWWERWPEANVGCATGAVSGFFVLDVDPRHGGDEEMAARGLTVPGTVTSLTGGSGTHYLCYHPGWTVGNDVSVYPGLDIRGDGGLIILPPSVHESGKTYTWEVSSRPGEVDIAQAPQWLLEALGNGSKEGTAKVPPEKRWLKDIPSGERNDTLYSLACELLGRGVPSSHVESHLWAQNVAYCKPQLQRDEISSICQSAISYFSSAGNDDQNANVPTSRPIYMRDNGTLMPVSLATVPEPEPRRFVIDGLIPEGDTSILYGDGGQGKSFLALYFGTCVATGTAVLDQKVERSNVLYLDWELTEDEQSRRIYKLARGMNLTGPPDGLDYLRMDTPLMQAIPQLKALIRDRHYGLIIVDSLGPACGGDPEAARFVIPLFNSIRSLGTTSLLIDHQSRLQQGQSYRNKDPFGSIYKKNLSRSAIQLHKVAEEEGRLALVLRHLKSNFTALRSDIYITIGFGADRILIDKANASELASMGAEEHLDSKQRILLSLRDRDRSTAEVLSDDTGISIKTVKNNLTQLNRAGLAYEVGKDGHATVYAPL